MVCDDPAAREPLAIYHNLPTKVPMFVIGPVHAGQPMVFDHRRADRVDNPDPTLRDFARIVDITRSAVQHLDGPLFVNAHREHPRAVRRTSPESKPPPSPRTPTRATRLRLRTPSGLLVPIAHAAIVP